MKIISGFLKGRKLAGYHIAGTRPTMDRIKESLFAMIQDYVKDSVCLDLYAGSGNLGIEAISNGAEKCFFVDANSKMIAVLKDNVERFEIASFCEIWNTTDEKALKRLEREQIAVDLVFLDPPYKTDYVDKILRKLDESHLVKKDGLIVCELRQVEQLGSYPTLEIYKQRRYQDKWIVIYKKM